MKYDTEHALAEVMKRRDERIRQKKEQRLTRGLSAATAVMGAALVAVICLCAEPGAVEVENSALGAFLLAKSTGGYVLTAVIAFVFGALLTLLCVRAQRRVKGQDPPDDRGGGLGH